MDTELDILKKKFSRLLELTRKTRGHQKEYFKYRAKSDLEKAKIWERQLDQFIKDEVIIMQNKQQDLFK
ncbi:hypothetical protein ACE38W_00610 [Chitinophaga sp. Hz27]|uniref:hypothetical protein n=1 Tax=Chitinophaga sp. Hz27 TaxID=3347169 RepID=UPI0035D7C9B3